MSLLEAGMVSDFETKLRRKDGTPFWASMTVIPQVTESGEKRFFTIIQDIAERKAAEEQLTTLFEQVKTFNVELELKIKERTRELEIALQTAEAASRAKSEFLSNMSHELRTPLTAVIGFSQMLQEEYFGGLNNKQQEYVKDILEAGQHLLTLINDVLDLAKVEAGKMELEITRFDVKRLIEDTLLMINEKALKHNIRIETVLPDDGDGLTLTADRLRIKQVLLNLLSNSVKFTPEGGSITLEARREPGEIQFSVADTGIGIDPEYQKRIFEVFFQAQSSITDKTPGTGLGLALCKRFVEMHGGNIWFTSNGKGQGTRFTFSIPVSMSAEKEVEAENEQDSTYSRR